MYRNTILFLFTTKYFIYSSTSYITFVYRQNDPLAVNTFRRSSTSNY